MFQPHLRPSSGRYIAKVGYAEISQKFMNQCTDVKYKVSTKYPSFVMHIPEDGHKSG